MKDGDAVPTFTTASAEVYNLHQIKDFDGEKRVRKKLFKSKQLWSEIACYEPGQSTVMHHHPFEEEIIYVLEGTANMNVDGEEIVLTAGSLVKFPPKAMHDVRNLQGERCVIMFTKIPGKLAKLTQNDGQQ